MVISGNRACGENSNLLHGLYRVAEYIRLVSEIVVLSMEGQGF